MDNMAFLFHTNKEVLKVGVLLFLVVQVYKADDVQVRKRSKVMPLNIGYHFFVYIFYVCTTMFMITGNNPVTWKELGIQVICRKEGDTDNVIVDISFFQKIIVAYCYSCREVR